MPFLLDYGADLLYNKGMEKLVIEVTDIVGEMKLSDYLKRNCGFSGALITKVKYGGVSVSGETVTMRKAVKVGDIIEISLPEEKNEEIAPVDIPLNIVYEDEYILVVNKPCGMPTHPAKTVKVPTLANAVVNYVKGNFVFRAINRLDSGTSGLVIIAKDAYSAAKLGRAMKMGEIKKKYLALLSGIPTPNEGRIDAPIERECEGSLKRVVRCDGKESITDYKVIGEHGENAICELTLHTGRTHQIRVHMAYIGHPLLNDFLYGKDEGGIYFLHCYEITLPHPKTNLPFTLMCEREIK